MSSSRSRLYGRRLLWLLLLLGFLALVASRFTSLRQLITTLSQARWQWLVIGVLTHVVFFYLYALLYEIGFDMVGVESRAISLLPVYFASLFVNAVAPTGGLGGAALFIDDAVRRGQSGARAAVGTVLVLLADLSTLLPFILAGVLYLLVQHELRLYIVVGVIIFALFTGGLAAALVLSRRRSARLRRFLAWIQRTGNRLGARFDHPDLLPTDWADQTAHQFAEAATAIADHPEDLLRALALGLVLHIVNLIGLYVLFPAFELAIQWGIGVAAFGLGIVFHVISILQGAAISEAVITLVLTSAGVPQAKAVVIALGFRGFNFWVPLIFGFFFSQRASSFRRERPSQPADEQT